ncbi:MAG: MCE family protein, partial [Bdellovibrionales bacterium]|nr:MCE family protein [Bdellovibrionales bacterium]
MKVKFNKFERVAGLFLLFTGFVVVLSFVSVAIQKGWFESKVDYYTEFETADGLTPGTQVHINGLRVGAVTDVFLGENNKVDVRFHVVERVAGKIKQDSVVRTFRPFVIGDRVLEVSVGSASASVLAPGSKVKSEKSLDVMDLVG